MSLAAIFDKARQVIPRWHTFPVARWLGVISAQTTSAITLEATYQERLNEWKQNGNLSHAADFLGNALVLNQFNDQEAQKAACHILTNRESATKPLIELAETFIRISKNESLQLPEVIFPEEIENFYCAISNLKARTKSYPRNPILWMDLAFFYSAIGQIEESKKAVSVALSLNKENRYLLRSGSRFFMHLGEPDQALHFLRHSKVGHHDPWLIAAEIAIADTIKSPPRRVKIAREMIGNGTVSNFHLSEMASALGTIELHSGARKMGKKLINLALKEPTENTLAQVAFLKEEFGEMVTPPSLSNIAHTFEAATTSKFYTQDFEGALEEAKKWFAYQPFSSRPAIVGSYITSVALGRHGDAIKIASMGLLSSPHDVMLRNNLAFSLASLGKVDEAKKILFKISESEPTDYQRHTLDATKALVMFREGNIVEGRKLYGMAVDRFRKKKDTRLETIARYFWAREEALIKSNISINLKEEALDQAKKFNIFEILSADKIEKASITS